MELSFLLGRPRQVDDRRLVALWRMTCGWCCKYSGVSSALTLDNNDVKPSIRLQHAQKPAELGRRLLALQFLAEAKRERLHMLLFSLAKARSFPKSGMGKSGALGACRLVCAQTKALTRSPVIVTVAVV